MKVAKQATTETSFLTLSGSEIIFLVTATVLINKADYDVND